MSPRSIVRSPGGAGGLQGLEFLRCLADQRLQGRGGGAHHSRLPGAPRVGPGVGPGVGGVGDGKMGDF